MLNWIKRLFAKPEPPKDFAEKPDASMQMLGQSAEALLENVAFNEAVGRIERDYFKMWRMSKPLDYEGREAIWRGLQGVSEIKLKLNGMANEMLIEKKRHGGMQ